MSTRFTAEVARALLQKLSSDDEFRALFQRDARAALRQLGHETPAADRGVRGRDPVVALQVLRGGLASKERIAAGSERMLAGYDSESGEALGFHQFDMCAE